MSSTLLRRLRLAIPLTTALALALPPSGASAGPLVAGAPNCDAQTLLQPFLPWADVASYTLNPGGSFEPGTAAWTLAGASVARGNEPFFVGSAGDFRSLSIPSGGGATSAEICVGLGHPDIRFFARGSNPTATLSVQVLFEDGSGNVQTLPIGGVTGSSGWALTAPMPIVPN